MEFFNYPEACNEEEGLDSAGPQKAELGAMSDSLGQGRKSLDQCKSTFAPTGNHLKLQASLVSLPSWLGLRQELGSGQENSLSPHKEASPLVAQG